MRYCCLHVCYANPKRRVTPRSIPLPAVCPPQEIRNMESFAGIDVYFDPERGGSGYVKKTIDIRSDAGWVRLVHDQREVVERDYRRLVELMPTMYNVSEGSGDLGE